MAIEVLADRLGAFVKGGNPAWDWSSCLSSPADSVSQGAPGGGGDCDTENYWHSNRYWATRGAISFDLHGVVGPVAAVSLKGYMYHTYEHVNYHECAGPFWLCRFTGADPPWTVDEYGDFDIALTDGITTPYVDPVIQDIPFTAGGVAAVQAALGGRFTAIARGVDDVGGYAPVYPPSSRLVYAYILGYYASYTPRLVLTIPPPGGSPVHKTTRLFLPSGRLA